MRAGAVEAQRSPAQRLSNEPAGTTGCAPASRPLSLSRLRRRIGGAHFARRRLRVAACFSVGATCGLCSARWLRPRAPAAFGGDRLRRRPHAAWHAAAGAAPMRCGPRPASAWPQLREPRSATGCAVRFAARPPAPVASGAGCGLGLPPNRLPSRPAIVVGCSGGASPSFGCGAGVRHRHARQHDRSRPAGPAAGNGVAAGVCFGGRSAARRPADWAHAAARPAPALLPAT